MASKSHTTEKEQEEERRQPSGPNRVEWRQVKPGMQGKSRRREGASPVGRIEPNGGK